MFEVEIKNLKKITFEFPSKPTFHDDDQLTFENKDYEGRIIDRFVGFIHLILKKNIEIEIVKKSIDPHYSLRSHAIGYDVNCLFAI